MKRFIAIVAIIFSTAQIFASDLIIRGEVDIPFSVYVNGQKYYSYYNQVTISNIPRGYYSVQIYAEGGSNELMYDCRINVPKRTTVTATFTGGNEIYVSSTRYATPMVIDVTPYPHRYAAPATPVHHEPAHVHHSVPKKSTPINHNSSAAKPAQSNTNATQSSSRPAQSNTSRSTTSSRSADAKSSSNSTMRSSAPKSSSSTSVNTSKSSSTSSSARSSSSTQSKTSTSRSTPSSRK